MEVRIWIEGGGAGLRPGAKTSRPRYSATTEKPSLPAAVSNLANCSCCCELSSSARFTSRILALLGAQIGHSPTSRSESPRQRWWNEWLQKKCTVGRSPSNGPVHALHLLAAKVLA